MTARIARTATPDLKALAAVIAERTADAYSWDNYGETGWLSATTMLLRRGYSEREAETILRSKWTRWAGDNATFRKGWKYGRTNGADLARFLDTMNPEKREAEVEAMTRETFAVEDRSCTVRDTSTAHDRWRAR